MCNTEVDHNINDIVTVIKGCRCMMSKKRANFQTLIFIASTSIADYNYHSSTSAKGLKSNENSFLNCLNYDTRQAKSFAVSMKLSWNDICTIAM